MFYRERVLELVRVEQAGQLGDGIRVPHVVARLAHRSSGAAVVVATTHLKAKSSAECEATRVQQLGPLLELVRSMAEGGAHVLLQGDFNAMPHDVLSADQCEVLVPARAARLARGYPLSNAFPLPRTAADAEWTSWKVRRGKEDRKSIDYMWHSPGLVCANHWSVPTAHEMGAGRLPSLRYPSDHLAMAAQFFFEH